ncbi:MAG TPA: Hsp20/alpha crystallin family protein [Frateuria sp.]|uniref:Hsp20/alpha crystallin family protein n=1 Tax=Frateuria sp. TaxID=2211372 RepID=UPI002DEBB95D|nr:Hsp20/alpha crystallin family protein [Frateuria sp.]
MNMLTRWNPARSLSRADPNDFDDFFRGFGLRPMLRDLEVAPEIRVDITENDGAYEIEADVPGVRKEDIDVTIDGSLVSITAEARRESEKKDGSREVRTERYYGQVFRSFSLPTDVDDAKAQARYENGVLRLHLPKKENGQQRRIKVG